MRKPKNVHSEIFLGQEPASTPASLASPCRVKQKRRRIRRVASGRTVYAYVGGNPANLIDPLGLRALTDCEKSLLSPHNPQVDLDKADIHDGQVPRYLSSDMAGTTRGNDIYFRPGAYQQGIVDGIGILGHELVHVGQYRNEMTWYKYAWESRKGYDENNKYEKPAYHTERRIKNDLNSAGTDCTCGQGK